jgi:hypothetical protein
MTHSPRNDGMVSAPSKAIHHTVDLKKDSDDSVLCFKGAEWVCLKVVQSGGYPNV